MKIRFYVFGIILLSGCYYDKKEILYPRQANGCDTVKATYSRIVAPIITSNCLGCHSSKTAASMGGGYDLEGYDKLAPYAGQNGLLIRTITHDPGVAPMPPSGKLSDCEITEVTTWVNEGAVNN